MTTWTVESAAAELLAAADQRRGRASLADEWPGFDATTAYAVQDAALARRLARGERLVGVKLGVTSRAKQKQVGVDSRYGGYRFTLADATADNASSARYVIGPRGVPPAELDLGLEACLLVVDGEVVDSATGAAVLGHPAEALAFAANALGRRGRTLEPGWLVLTGGMTDAVPLAPGRSIGVEFTHLGSISVAGH